MCGEIEQKRIRFVLSPELSDGQSQTVVDTPQQAADMVLDWALERVNDVEGETCSIKTKSMSDAECEALPEL